MIRVSPDYVNGIGTAYKPWEVGAIFTTHRLIDQVTVRGRVHRPHLGARRRERGQQAVNDYEFYARYDMTKHDRIGLQAYVYEYFLATRGRTASASTT